MQIWLTIPSLSKTSGGPTTVVQHLSEHLVSSGASVAVLTAEPITGQSEALPRDQRVNVIRVHGKGRGAWRSAFESRLQEALSQKFQSGKESIVHDFGLWLPANHAVCSVCQHHGVPRVCSPCGMLAPWALRHKAWKKRLAWWLYQRRDLSCTAVLVATANQELQDIRQRVPGKNIAVLPNGVELPSIAMKPRRDPGNRQRIVVFLGRIHPIKGLMNLVEAWQIIQPSGWRCILAGPDEAGHRNELESLLRSRKLEKSFEFPGMLEDEQKWALLKEADFFVLPSFSENFGVAVIEALACGTPVITTKGTPWKGVIDHRCGWWIDIGIQPLAATMREAMSLSDEDRYEMGQRGRRLVEEKYSWPRIGREMHQVYQWVLGKGLQPSCVRSKQNE